MVSSVSVLPGENSFLRDQLQVMVTCEHGGNNIPAPYTPLFSKAGNLLASHRGYDPGALELARLIAGTLRAPLFFSTVTRLLIDTNRSSTNKNIFSSVTKNLTTADKEHIITTYYTPYRSSIELHIKRCMNAHAVVVHLAIHSFTPVLHGRIRTADIGLLYDPTRSPEKDFCIRLARNLLRSNPQVKARRNYPYCGRADGLTTYLRKQFFSAHYLGMEIEINQKFPLGSRSRWNSLQNNFIAALEETLISFVALRGKNKVR